jgi:hypothetical protein
MTVHAGNPSMLSQNLELKIVMIEIRNKTVHAIMAGKTGRSKGQRMCSYEHQIH